MTGIVRAALLPRRKRSKLEVRYDYVVELGRVHDKTDKFTDLFSFSSGEETRLYLRIPCIGRCIHTNHRTE